jgi:hypothetical protein
MKQFRFDKKIFSGLSSPRCYICRKKISMPYYWVYTNKTFSLNDDNFFYFASVCSEECQTMLMLKEM